MTAWKIFLFACCFFLQLFWLIFPSFLNLWWVLLWVLEKCQLQLSYILVSYNVLIYYFSLFSPSFFLSPPPPLSLFCGTSFSNMKDFFHSIPYSYVSHFILLICVYSMSVLLSRYFSDLFFSLLVFCPATTSLLLNLSIKHFLLVIVFSVSTMCIWNLFLHISHDAIQLHFYFYVFFSLFVNRLRCV